MKNKLLMIWNSVSNYKSVLAITGAVIIILQNMGYNIDNETIMSTVDKIAYILIIFGILNKEGMETSKWNK